MVCNGDVGTMVKVFWPVQVLEPCHPFEYLFFAPLIPLSQQSLQVELVPLTAKSFQSLGQTKNESSV